MQCHTMGGFAKDCVPCVCMVALAVVGASFAFPAEYTEGTGLEWNIILRKAENREEWRKLVVKSTVVPQRSTRLGIEEMR